MADQNANNDTNASSSLGWSNVAQLGSQTLGSLLSFASNKDNNKTAKSIAEIQSQSAQNTAAANAATAQSQENAKAYDTMLALLGTTNQQQDTQQPQQSNNTLMYVIGAVALLAVAYFIFKKQ